MRIRWASTVFAATLIVQAVTLGQTPVIIAGPPESIRLLPDQTLTQAMELVGCDPGWLSAVATANKIDAKRLLSLSWGEVLSVPAGVDCRKPAPPEVAQLTKAMLATGAAIRSSAAVQSQLSAVRQENEELTAKLREATRATEAAAAEGRVCADAKSKVESELQSVQTELGTVRAELAARWPAWGVFLIGLLVGLVVGAGVIFALRR